MKPAISQCFRVAAAACAAAAIACGSSSSSTTTPTTTTPTVTSVTITGTAPAIPNSAQFTATANMSDNTTKDVTAISLWSSSNTAVLTAVAGLITAVTAGDASVSATYLGITGTKSVSIAKPLPYSVSGTVTDASTKGPLPNIIVAGLDSSLQAGFATTDANGRYTIGNLLAGSAVISVTSQGIYIGSSKTITISGNTTGVDFALAHVNIP